MTDETLVFKVPNGLSFINRPPGNLVFYGALNPQWVLRILPSGLVEINPHIEQTVAARHFIDCVNQLRGIPSIEAAR